MRCNKEISMFGAKYLLHDKMSSCKGDALSQSTAPNERSWKEKHIKIKRPESIKAKEHSKFKTNRKKPNCLSQHVRASLHVI